MYAIVKKGDRQEWRMENGNHFLYSLADEFGHFFLLLAINKPGIKLLLLFARGGCK
jgi:hypothetical protein